jgi:hypothetical protein
MLEFPVLNLDHMTEWLAWGKMKLINFLRVIKCVLHSCLIFRSPGFKFRTETIFLD